MKLKFIFVLFLSFSAFSTSAQSAKNNVKKALTVMADATVKGDYSILADLTYPKALSKLGGKDSVVMLIKKTFDKFKEQGMYIKALNINGPDSIFMIAGNLFCIATQTTIVKVNNGSISANSSTFGVSEDGGAHWYFIGTGSSGIKTIYEFFREVKGKIIIPKDGAQVFTPDPK